MATIPIPLDKIMPNPWQTRQGEPDKDYVRELADDIHQNGLLQTPIGRLVADTSGPGVTNVEEMTKARSDALLGSGYYVQLAFGHNRLAAYRHNFLERGAGWGRMPVEIRQLTDEQMAMMAWSENEKRRDVTPIERALAIQQRIQDFGWSNRQAGEALGLDHSTISNILRLLKLPDNLQDALQAGDISERQALALLPLFEAPEITEFEYGPTKRSVIGSAFDGRSSGELRKQVENWLFSHSKKLAEAEFKLDELFKESSPIYCGLCSTCDRRMASRNLCFDPTCYNEKTKRVRLLYLANVSVKTGYPILDPRKEGYPTSIPDSLIEQIKEIKCPNLVVAYGPGDHMVDGHKNAHLVCEKRNRSCTCIRGLRANQLNEFYEKVSPKRPEDMLGPEEDYEEDLEEIQEDDDDVDEPEEVQPAPAPAAQQPLTNKQLEDVARQQRRAKKEVIERRGEILRLVQARLAEALLYQAPGVFYLIARHSSYVFREAMPSNKDLYDEIARDLARQYVIPEDADSLLDMLSTVNKKLSNLQLEPVSFEKTLAEVFSGDET